MVATRASGRAKSRADSTAEAAVRMPVMKVPSITHEAMPVSGSNSRIIARWFGSPSARLPSKTLTTLIAICMPGRHAGIASEKPLPGTVSSGRAGDCTSPRASAPKPSSRPSSSARGSSRRATSASLSVMTRRGPFAISNAAGCFLM